MADRLFLDANVLFSVAWREGAGLGRLWSVQGATLVTSEYAIEEARRNLLDESRRVRLDEYLSRLTVYPSRTLSSSQRSGVQLREKDWPILGGAVISGATHLITGDLRDFGPFLDRVVLGVRVMTPAAYLAPAP